MLLLALPSALAQLWECWQSSLVSLRCSVHKATSAEPLKSGTRTAAVMHLDRHGNYGGSPDPGPASACMC